MAKQSNPDREMWADLYRYYEKARGTPVNTPEWTALGPEAGDLVKKYDDNWFVRDVLSLTLSYFVQKA